MKERLFKYLLDRTFLYDFFINNILYKLFPKEEPEFYAKHLDKNNFLQKLYSIKDIFHKQLYYHDDIYYINQEYIKSELSDYIFLSLLISYESDIIHYNYDYNLIISINKKNKSSENSLKKAMISKIIIGLINNFKNVKDNEEKFENELNAIEKENKEIIEQNIDKIKELKINLTIDDIISMKIDDIYIKVIKSIMISDKFEDSEKICSQLGLDVINIPNLKFKELEKIIIIENYMISEIQDLFNKEKINYYYILVKYIFNTNSIIYNINLLKNFQHFLIKIIKSKLYELYINYIDNEAIYEKRNYVIKFILNNEYYYQKYLEAIKLIELIYYYKTCLSESKKKEEIVLIEMILKNNKININEKKYEIEYLNFQIIKFIQKHKFNDLKEATEKWIYIQKQIKNKALKDLENYYVLLIKCHRDEFIKEIFIKIFPKNIFDYFEEEISIISLQFDEYKRFCTFLYPSLNENEVGKEIFSYYIKKKNNFSEKIKLASNNIKYESKNIKKIIKYWAEKTDEKNNEIIKNSNELIKGLINWEQFFTKINEDFEIELEFIFKREKDLSNESFYNISYECYYITFKKIKESDVPKELEKTKSTEINKYEESRELVATISNALNINDGMNIENIIAKIGVPFKKKNIEIIKENPLISPISFIFKDVKENNNIEDTIELNENHNLKINNNRIQIDENLYSLLTKERDLIIHWNTGKQYKIIGYSIEITNNKLNMIQKSYQNNDRVILCCCKSQIKEKNGILFIEIDKKETETLINNITDFKVECMCLLYKSDDITRNNSNSKEKNNINDNSNNNDYSKRNYFLLIGGFDIKEKRPKIKLFQVLVDEKSNNEEKDHMEEENKKGIRLSEIPDDTLSELKFESNIISINQNESEITILTKENTYTLFFDINDN